MGKFARLIDLSIAGFNEQVLLTLEYGDDLYEVCIATNFDEAGLAARITLGFEDKGKAMDLLEDYTKEDAIKFRQSMADMLGVEK